MDGEFQLKEYAKQYARQCQLKNLKNHIELLNNIGVFDHVMEPPRLRGLQQECITTIYTALNDSALNDSAIKKWEKLQSKLQLEQPMINAFKSLTTVCDNVDSKSTKHRQFHDKTVPQWLTQHFDATVAEAGKLIQSIDATTTEYRRMILRLNLITMRRNYK